MEVKIEYWSPINKTIIRKDDRFMSSRRVEILELLNFIYTKENEN